MTVTGGGKGTPGPLVSFPGAYTGYGTLLLLGPGAGHELNSVCIEPGILIDIYYPIPANYTQPGPVRVFLNRHIEHKLNCLVRLFGPVLKYCAAFDHSYLSHLVNKMQYDY